MLRGPVYLLRARALPLSPVLSPLSSRGSLSGEGKWDTEVHVTQTRPPEVGLLCPAPAGFAISAVTSSPQWLRVMALQVGKSHSPGRLQMLEEEGRGRPAGHLLLIELGNICIFPSDPKQRGCGGKVGPPPQSNTEVETLGLVWAGVPQ